MLNHKNRMRIAVILQFKDDKAKSSQGFIRGRQWLKEMGKREVFKRQLRFRILLGLLFWLGCDLLRVYGL